MIDSRTNIEGSNPLFFWKLSFQEIETQYNLIKMILAEPQKYNHFNNAIKKDIDYRPIKN